jgi:hypothetical protein
MTGNAESAPRCANHRTRKRQLSTETAGNNFGNLFGDPAKMCTQGYTGVHRGMQGYTVVHRGTQGYIAVHGGAAKRTGRNLVSINT